MYRVVSNSNSGVGCTDGVGILAGDSESNTHMVAAKINPWPKPAVAELGRRQHKLKTNTQTMKKLGGTLFFFGVGSIVLYFLGMQFIILAWIDLWGSTIGWMIRAALIIVGAILWLIGRKEENA
jgi:hypothetical protein